MDNVRAHTRRRGKPPGRHPDKALSPAFIRSAPSGRHCDGQGLYLLVQPTGTRSWVQRLVVRGRRRELGLGSIPLVSLAEAREKALANRKVAREVGDPLAERRRAVGAPTFADGAACAPAHPRRDGVDHRHAVSRRQSVRPALANERMTDCPHVCVAPALVAVRGDLRYSAAATARSRRRLARGRGLTNGT